MISSTCLCAFANHNVVQWTIKIRRFCSYQFHNIVPKSIHYAQCLQYCGLYYRKCGLVTRHKIY